MNDLNLVPKSILQNQAKGKKKNVLSKIIAVTVAGFIGVNIFYFLKYKNLETKLNDVNSKLSSYDNVLKEDKLISKETTLIVRHIDKTKALEKENFKKPSRIIKEFQKEIPKEIIIQDFNYEENKISISATSSSYKAVLDFWANIKNSDKYRAIELPYINEEGNKKYNFTSVIEVVREAESE